MDNRQADLKPAAAGEMAVCPAYHRVTGTLVHDVVLPSFFPLTI